MRATQSDPFALVRQWDAERLKKGWWHSFELPDGTIIDGVNPVTALRDRISQFPVPADLRGKRVLDIGAWDGWFTFEMERRGAEVVAIDNWDNPRFRHMHALLGSRASYLQLDMYELTPERIGRFDIVLFMGVLYHLKHPLLALERVCALTTDMAVVDSFVLRDKHRPGEQVENRPVMEFYETDELGGQTDNWVGPTVPCLLAFCRTAGFARVELQNVLEFSACIACYRKWEDPPPGAEAGAELREAFHNTNVGINFNSRYDEALSVVFSSPVQNLTLDQVRPEVREFGVRPFHIKSMDGELWQANFKLPPGLTPGWHEVRLRIGSGLPSNALTVAVDMPFPPEQITITGACDGSTWEPDQLDRRNGNVLSIWVSGLPINADRNNVSVYLAGARLEVAYVERRQDSLPKQINVVVPGDMPPGSFPIEAAAGAQRTEPRVVEVR